MTTTTAVDLDNVLAVAGELRRMCSRAVKVGISFSVFKQESWEAALAHVQDIHAGKEPSIRSDSPFCRLLAHCPRPTWRLEHLEGLQEARVFDGGGRTGVDDDGTARRRRLGSPDKGPRTGMGARRGRGRRSPRRRRIRYVLSSESAALFVVRPHPGGVSRCEEPWERAVLAGPVNQVVLSYVPPGAYEGEAVEAQDGAGEREGARRPGRGEERPRNAGGRAARVLNGERRMKQKRSRAIPREGPPCRLCGRPTQRRNNWTRLTAVLPMAERFKSRHHHLCRRCFRRQRPERPTRSEPPPPVTHEKSHQTNRTRPKR